MRLYTFYRHDEVTPVRGEVVTETISISSRGILVTHIHYVKNACDDNADHFYYSEFQHEASIREGNSFIS